MRSEIVDLPWSMCATIEKLRMWEVSKVFMLNILPEMGHWLGARLTLGQVLRIVDLPWSMCATIEKLRMWEVSKVFMLNILPEMGHWLGARLTLGQVLRKTKRPLDASLRAESTSNERPTRAAGSMAVHLPVLLPPRCGIYGKLLRKTKRPLDASLRAESTSNERPTRAAGSMAVHLPVLLPPRCGIYGKHAPDPAPRLDGRAFTTRFRLETASEHKLNAAQRERIRFSVDSARAEGPSGAFVASQD